MHRQHLTFIRLQGGQYALHLIDRRALERALGQGPGRESMSHVAGKNADEMNDPTGEDAVIGQDQERTDHPDSGSHRPPAGGA